MREDPIMSFETDIFDANYEMLPQARCQLKIGHDEIETALCSGIERERIDTDQGQCKILSGDVWYKAVDGPPREIKIGDKLQISFDGDDWLIARVSGNKADRRETIRLKLESPNV